MRFVTWNINSVRLRIALLERLIDRLNPDVICLQETKVPDAEFPKQPLQTLGYDHLHVHGMKGYNGVAILSRVPLSDTRAHDWCGKRDCRHIVAGLAGGIDLHCLYVPSGGDVPDPEQNPKFKHKLQFLDELTEWSATSGILSRTAVLVGDLNIAPLENDVWSHKDMLTVVSHTPVEVDRLDRLRAARDWVDVARHFVPADEKLYTWWSYRAKDWERSDRGRRLDHIWVTPDLTPKLAGFEVFRAARGWQPKPSDHVPVVLDLAL